MIKQNNNREEYKILKQYLLKYTQTYENGILEITRYISTHTYIILELRNFECESSIRKSRGLQQPQQ